MTDVRLTQRTVGWRIGRVFALTFVILLVTLIAMQLSEDVNWSLFDFIIIATLLSTTGLAYEILASTTKDRKRRLVIAVILLATMLTAWAEMAVGLFGSPIAGD